MDTEYKYLCVSIILLMISYYFLKFTKNNMFYISNINEIENNKFNKTVYLKNNNELEVDSNLFEMYMGKLKNNIIKTSSNITNEECRGLKKYLDKSKSILNREIDNIKKYDNNFCTNEFDRLINLNVVEYRKKIDKELNIHNSDKLKNESNNLNKVDELKDKIIDILVDIEIISYLIRNTSCKRNEVDISYINTLLQQIYNTKCNSVDNTVDHFTSNNFESPIYNIISDTNSINIDKDNIESDTKNKNNKMGILEDVVDSIKYTSYTNQPSPMKYMPNFIIDSKNNPSKQDYSSKAHTSHFKEDTFDNTVIRDSIKTVTHIHDRNKTRGIVLNNNQWDPRDFTHVDKSAKTSLFS